MKRYPAVVRAKRDILHYFVTRGCSGYEKVVEKGKDYLLVSIDTKDILHTKYILEGSSFAFNAEDFIVLTGSVTISPLIGTPITKITYLATLTKDYYTYPNRPCLIKGMTYEVESVCFGKFSSRVVLKAIEGTFDLDDFEISVIRK